ncbi:MAG: flagellin, partial [Rhodospirillales bacterium]|nr:flagellin [Rhodospirillales bacterium]
MTSSVNTNTGALNALKFLRATSADLTTVQARVSTGLRVSSALDDASTFAVAQGIRGDIKGYTAVSQALGSAKGIAKVALSAATAISNKMQDIKAKLVQLSDQSVTGNTRTTYENDYAALTAQLQVFINNATYNAVNLLKSTSTDQKVVANIDGSTVTIRRNDLETSILAAAPASAAAA